MNKLHVINVGKHNPNYKDRTNVWCKIKFNSLRDHGFARLCEIDKWRFVHFIILEIETKSPVPLDNEYLKRQGFDLKSRCLTSTIRQLADSKLVEIRSEAEWEQVNSRVEADQQQELKCVESEGDTTKSVTQKRKEKSRKEKKIIYVKDGPPNLDQINDYISKKGYSVNGQYFLDVYENANPPWSNKKGELMRSWKGTLATWSNNSKSKDERKQWL
jgi:hypothetical protein